MSSEHKKSKNPFPVPKKDVGFGSIVKVLYSLLLKKEIGTQFKDQEGFRGL